MKGENIMKTIPTIEYCMKMYQIGMIAVITNGKLTGFKEEIS